MSEYLEKCPVPVDILFAASFKGFRGSISRSKFSGEVFYELDQDAHRIFITLDGQTAATIAETDQHPTVSRPDRPGVITVVPAGVRRRVLLRDVDFLILEMTVSDAFIQLCAGNESACAPAIPPFVQNVQNDWLLRAAQAFHEAGMSGAPSIQLQTLTFAMMRHLTRSPGKVSQNGGLDPSALSRIMELMHDRLSDDLSLTDLADEAGLGVSAFSRAFGKSIGSSPYRYFAALRMQRAKELLIHSNQPLTEIAGETGYSDQAHFTAAFTRAAGMSPGKWRAEFGTVPDFLPISRKTTRVRPASFTSTIPA